MESKVAVPWGLFDEDDSDDAHDVEDSGSAVVHEAAQQSPSPPRPAKPPSPTAAATAVAAARGPARCPVPLQYTLRACVDFFDAHARATTDDLAELVGRAATTPDVLALAAATLTQLQALSHALRAVAEASLPPPPAAARRGGGKRAAAPPAAAPPRPSEADTARLVAAVATAANTLHATTWGWLDTRKSWPHVALREAFVFAQLCRAVAAGASGSSAEEGMSALDLALIMGAPARELASLCALYDRACLMEGAANEAVRPADARADRARVPRRIPAVLGPGATFSLPPELVALAETRRSGAAPSTDAAAAGDGGAGRPHGVYVRRVGAVPSAVAFSATTEPVRRGGRGGGPGGNGGGSRAARVVAQRRAASRAASTVPASIAAARAGKSAATEQRAGRGDGASATRGGAAEGGGDDNDASNSSNSDEDDDEDEEEEEHPTIAALRALDDRAPLPLAEFRRRHVRGSQPVVLSGVMRGWPALQRWRSLRELAARHGHRTVPVEHGVHLTSGWREEPMRLRALLADYLAPSVRAWGGSGSGGDVAYLAQHGLFEQLPELMDDFTVPTYAGDDVGAVNVWLGTAGTVTRSHFDSYDNLLCQVAGYKLVRLHAPADSSRLYPVAGGAAPTKGGTVEPPAPQGAAAAVSTAQGNVSSVDVEAPDLARHPLYAEATAYDALLGPGDVLFIPRLWWHYVRALTPSISLNAWF